MPEQIPIMVISGRQRIAGFLDHGGHRVLDVLNDAGTDYLQLQNATIGQNTTPLDGATLLKSGIDFVVLVDEVHEAPLRQRYAFVEKQTYSAVIVVAEYVLHGSLQMKGRADTRIIVGRDAPTFFPMTDVVYGDEGSRPVALVNKARVVAISLGHQTALL